MRKTFVSTRSWQPFSMAWDGPLCMRARIARWFEREDANTDVGGEGGNSFLKDVVLVY